jgi:hypothetical protein
VVYSPLYHALPHSIFPEAVTAFEDLISGRRYPSSCWAALNSPKRYGKRQGANYTSLCSTVTTSHPSTSTLLRLDTNICYRAWLSRSQRLYYHICLNIITSHPKASCEPLSPRERTHIERPHLLSFFLYVCCETKSDRHLVL